MKETQTVKHANMQKISLETMAGGKKQLELFKTNVIPDNKLIQ